jgi:hypothetical protein
LACAPVGVSFEFHRDLSADVICLTASDTWVYALFQAFNNA